MSRIFTSTTDISMEELLDGRLEKHGVRELATASTQLGQKCLTDGTNSLWVVGEDIIIKFICYGCSHPDVILNAVGSEFSTVFFSEYRDQYPWERGWFDWDELEEADPEARENAVVEEIIQQCNGAPTTRIDIESPSYLHAFIARTLTERNPSLLCEEQYSDLLAITYEIFCREGLIDTWLENTAAGEIMAARMAHAYLNSAWRTSPKVALYH
jgi:hypothetical protein